MSGSPHRIVLLGSNSGRNAGDAALLETVIEQISLRRPGTVFEVPTTHPGFVSEHLGSEKVIPISIMPWNLSLRLLGLPVLRSLKRSDLSLVMDGIIFDHRLFNPAFNFLITLIFLAPFARWIGKPMVCFEVGIGPLKKKIGKKFARIVAEACELILVREDDSRLLLEEAGVRKTPIETYADAAFLVTPAPESRIKDIIEKLDAGGREIVGLNLTRYGASWMGPRRQFDRHMFQRRTASVIDRFSEMTGAVVVLTATQHMDHEYLMEVKSLVRRKDNVRMISNVSYTPGELAGIMGRMEMFIGMRLHSLILASSMKTPVLGLTYAPKVRSFFKMVQRPELALDLGALNEETMLENFLVFWNERKREKSRLSPLIDNLKQRAALGFDRLVESFL